MLLIGSVPRRQRPLHQRARGSAVNTPVTFVKLSRACENDVLFDSVVGCEDRWRWADTHDSRKQDREQHRETEGPSGLRLRAAGVQKKTDELRCELPVFLIDGAILHGVR